MRFALNPTQELEICIISDESQRFEREVAKKRSHTLRFWV